MAVGYGIREELCDLFGASAAGVYTDEKAITSAITGNVIDLNSIDPADVPRYRLVIYCGTAGAGGTSVAFAIKSADNAAFSDPTTHETITVLTAKLTAGAKVVDIDLPRDCGRYLRVDTTNSGTYTAGTVRGWVQPEL